MGMVDNVLVHGRPCLCCKEYLVQGGESPHSYCYFFALYGASLTICFVLGLFLVFALQSVSGQRLPVVRQQHAVWVASMWLFAGGPTCCVVQWFPYFINGLKWRAKLKRMQIRLEQGRLIVTLFQATLSVCHRFLTARLQRRRQRH